MRLHYGGRYNGDPASLPTPEHREGAVKFREPGSIKTLSLVANGIALAMYFVTLSILFYRGGVDAYSLGAVILTFVCMIPHEFLHAICFKEDAYIYHKFSHGMLFVVGPETMSRARFIFMSMLPNLVFGFIPFALFLINPSLTFLGTLGAMSIPCGAGDYMNVFNALTQMPKGARTYLHQMNSYWYLPKEEQYV